MFLKKIVSKLRGNNDLEKLQKMGLVLGKNCSISPNAEIDYSHCWLIKIGNDVTITSHCIILAHDASTKRDLGYAKIGKVVIEDNVFIGVNSVILPNTCIGANTIIGAGSVVCGNIEANSVYAGVPAVKICDKQDFLNKHSDAIQNCAKVFDESYTIRKNISDAKKKEMLDKLDSGVGYVE